MSTTAEERSSDRSSGTRQYRSMPMRVQPHRRHHMVPLNIACQCAPPHRQVGLSGTLAIATFSLASNLRGILFLYVLLSRD